MPRASKGLEKQANLRMQPTEHKWIRVLAAELGCSQNDAVRWAIRFAVQHSHTPSCARNSFCRSASFAVLGDHTFPRSVRDQTEPQSDVPEGQLTTDDATSEE